MLENIRIKINIREILKLWLCTYLECPKMFLHVFQDVHYSFIDKILILCK